MANITLPDNIQLIETPQSLYIMVKDYKHTSSGQTASRKKNKREERRGMSGGTGLLIGLTIGLLVAAAVFIYDRSGEIAATQTENAAPPVTAKKEHVQTETTPEVPKPRFDFYTLLPELEVIIPESEIKEEQARIAPKENVHYTLQVGSFRNHDDADSLKAQLAFLGIESDIQKVSSGGEKWFRVRVGPFNNTRDMNKIRNRLHANDYNPMLVKDKASVSE